MEKNTMIRKVEIDINLNVLVKWFLFFVGLWMLGLTVVIFVSPFFIPQIPHVLAITLACINGLIGLLGYSAIRLKLKRFKVIER